MKDHDEQGGLTEFDVSYIRSFAVVACSSRFGPGMGAAKIAELHHGPAGSSLVGVQLPSPAAVGGVPPWRGRRVMGVGGLLSVVLPALKCDLEGRESQGERRPGGSSFVP